MQRKVDTTDKGHAYRLQEALNALAQPEPFSFVVFAINDIGTDVHTECVSRLKGGHLPALVSAIERLLNEVEAQLTRLDA